MTALRHYGGEHPACKCCGEDKYQFLAFDHINGRGKEHLRRVSNIALWLVRNDFPAGFQILCHNCNLAKGFYGRCPHQGSPVPVFVSEIGH
jgi:hypothetical protein